MGDGLEPSSDHFPNFLQDCLNLEVLLGIESARFFGESDKYFEKIDFRADDVEQLGFFFSFTIAGLKDRF